MLRLPLTEPPPPVRRPVNPDEYRRHELANRAAAEVYAALPISLGRVAVNGAKRACTNCRRPTWAMSGMCSRCDNWRVT